MNDTKKNNNMGKLKKFTEVKKRKGKEKEINNEKRMVVPLLLDRIYSYFWYYFLITPNHF